MKISLVQKRLNITVASEKLKIHLLSMLIILGKNQNTWFVRESTTKVVTKIYHNELISEVSNQLIRENTEAIQAKTQPIAHKY